MNAFLQRGPHESRVFAVDGSKVHIHPSFLKDGYKTRTNDKPVSRPAKRPLVVLSCMVDVRTKACVDFDLTKHFDERSAATTLLRSVTKGDTLVFDRGYFSREPILRRGSCARGIFSGPYQSPSGSLTESR